MAPILHLLIATVALAASVAAETSSHQNDNLITMGARVFNLGAPLKYGHEPGDKAITLEFVEWIENLAQRDPLLKNTVIIIKDQTPELPVTGWIWRSDDLTRFHPDLTLPPLFNLEGYEVGWLGLDDAPVRGDILIFPKSDPKQFNVICAYDRADAVPGLCSVLFRYGPDPNLLIDTRVWFVTSPMNDFAEIATRVDALIRCIDVTEVVKAGGTPPAYPSIGQADIEAGGKCRPLPMD